MVRGRGSLGPSHHHQGSNNNCLTDRSTGCGRGGGGADFPPKAPPPSSSSSISPLFSSSCVVETFISSLSRPFARGEEAAKSPLYIPAYTYTNGRAATTSFHMWRRLFSMQFAAALKHEERERERAEISAPRHRKYHSFRARVSSSCSSWVSAAALPASQRRLNRKKDCFRTKEEKKREEKKKEKGSRSSSSSFCSPLSTHWKHISF